MDPDFGTKYLQTMSTKNLRGYIVIKASVWLVCAFED